MVYAIKLFFVMIECAYRIPATIAFSLTPHWYFNSAVLSHALKSPLTSLAFALDDASNSLHTPRRLKRALAQANTARQRINSMLLAGSTRMDTYFAVERSIATVVAWIDSMGHEVHILHKSKAVKTAMVFGSQHQFEQLLEIVLTNAIKASTGNDLIVLSTVIVGEELTIMIQDFGVGMSGLDVLRCGLHGYTTNTVGWGIGLSCARKIIAQFRGQLRIHSQENIGTQIICTLPLGHVSDTQSLSLS